MKIVNNTSITFVPISSLGSGDVFYLPNHCDARMVLTPSAALIESYDSNREDMVYAVDLATGLVSWYCPDQRVQSVEAEVNLSNPPLDG